MIKDNKKPKIGVIGDAILDKYSFGKVERISPEAPIPILLIDKEEYKPGGAGNVAANLATLGADVDLFSIVGDDHYKQFLIDSLDRYGIRSFLVTDPSRPTILKQRCIAAGQQLLRIDYESKELLKNHHINELKSNFGSYDAVIVSDYGKGVICHEIMEFLKSKNVPIFVDPKPTNKELYKNVFFITPNKLECTQLAHEKDDLRGAEKLRKDLNTNILLKRGDKGIALYRIGKEPILLPSEAKYLVDVTGAGDTVIATMVYFYTKGMDIEECVRLANQAAGISISQLGCYQVKEEELI